MKTTSSLWVAALAGALLACSSHGAVATAPAQAAVATQYRCPMHPSIVQDHPGDCPVCNMKLVPIAPAAAGAQGAAHVEGAPAPRAAAAASSPGAIAVGADKQKVIGVTVAAVQQGPGTRTLRLLGRVAPDEKRVYKVNAGVEGSIREVTPVTTGSWVKRDQLLATFWAPSTLSIMQLYILNTSGKEYLVQRHTEGSVEGEGRGLAYANIQQRVMQLENIGVSAMQREEMARTRKIPDTIQLRAPGDGFVLARNVTPSMKFDRGAELYRIADLRRVWVVADVFLHDARHVRPGMKATVSVPEQDVALPATVAEILPQFDGTTRTLKVRLELDNPGYVLRPDMFVDVGLGVKLPAGMTIPADAIIDSGLMKTVFVQSGEGTFEPRRVETGWRSGDQVEIVKGLSPGDRIVTSGTFFLDSESRLRSPPSGAAVVDRTVPDPTGHEHRADGGAGPSSGAPASGDHEVKSHEAKSHAHAGE